MAKKAQPSQKRPWLVPALIVSIVVVAALIAYFFGEQIATFVRFRGAATPGSASVQAIACIDVGEDGSCDGDTGRVADVSLTLSETGGTSSSQTTDANGTARFEQVSVGTHELLVALPFAGRLTVDNPILVTVPASGTGTVDPSETVVFVPVSLGERTSQFTIDLWYVDSTQPGAVLETEPDTDTAYVFYPGQQFGTRIGIHSNADQQDRQRYTVISDYDDACTESVSRIRPITGRDDSSKVQWSVNSLTTGKFDRTFSYNTLIDTALPEISPLICTDRVTLLDSTGATVGTTTRSYQIIPLPTDRAVLQIDKSVTDDNGGAVKAGDTLTYVLGITNIGLVAEAGAVLLDDMPALLGNPELVLAPDPTKVEVSATGGANGSGFIKVTNLDVPVTRQVGEQVTITFKATVSAAEAKRFDAIDNYVTLKGTAGAYAEAISKVKVGQALQFVTAAPR